MFHETSPSTGCKGKNTARCTIIRMMTVMMMMMMMMMIRIMMMMMMMIMMMIIIIIIIIEIIVRQRTYISTQAMKKYGGVELWQRPFFTSGLDNCDWPISFPADLFRRKDPQQTQSRRKTNSISCPEVSRKRIFTRSA